MKKILLSAICATVVASSSFAAAPTFTEMKAISFNDIITPANANRTNKVRVNANGDVYLTGLFDTEFTAKTPLTPIATSSYIIRFDNKLSAQTNIAIQGAATITSIASDDYGFCVAGTYADEVVFESANGKTQTIQGMKIGDVYTTQQNSSFFAAYNAKGDLMYVTAFVPKVHSELVGSELYYDEAEIFFRINDIKLMDNGALFSAIYKGRTEVSGEVFEAGYVNVFDFMYQDLAAGAVFLMTGDEMNNLHIKKIASFTPGNKVDTESIAISASAATAGSNIYPGFVISGTGTLQILDSKEEVSFPASQEGNPTYGYVIIAANKENNTFSKNIFSTSPSISFKMNEIKQMAIMENQLLVGGTFLEGLAFDNSIKAVGDDDIYVVSLNPETLAVNWKYTTGYDEKAPKLNQEIFTNFSVLNGFIRINGYSEVKKDHILLNNLAFNIDTTKGTIIDYTESDKKCITGSDGIANQYFEASVTQPSITGVTLTKYSVTSGVNDAIANNDVTAYPNPTTDILNFSTACNVKVFAIDGKVVANQSDVTSINVSSLSNGVYFVTITKDNATKTVKIIKK